VGEKQKGAESKSSCDLTTRRKEANVRRYYRWKSLFMRGEAIFLFHKNRQTAGLLAGAERKKREENRRRERALNVFASSMRGKGEPAATGLICQAKKKRSLRQRKRDRRRRQAHPRHRKAKQRIFPRREKRRENNNNKGKRRRFYRANPPAGKRGRPSLVLHDFRGLEKKEEGKNAGGERHDIFKDGRPTALSFKRKEKK